MKRLFYGLLLVFLLVTPGSAERMRLNRMGISNVTDMGELTQTRLNADNNFLQLKAKNGLTFFKDYGKLSIGVHSANDLIADFAVGSRVPIFSATRSGSAPATYVDENGVIQLVTTSDTARIQGGFYDYTGFNYGFPKYVYPTTTPSWNGDIRSPDIVPSGTADMFRSIVKVGSTYYMYLEQEVTGVWGVYYRTSTDRSTWSSRSSAVMSAGGGGSFDEKGQADPSVIYDGVNDWKMWFDAKNGSDVWASLGYATSTDGTTWSKVGSVLDKGAAGTWDADFIHHPCVIKDGSTYYMFYAGSKTPAYMQIGLATSINGTTWTKYAGNPVIGTGANDNGIGGRRPGHPFKIGTTWYMLVWSNRVSDSDDIWHIYTSPDLYTWTDTGIRINPGSETWKDDGHQANQVINESDGMKLFFVADNESATYYSNIYYSLIDKPTSAKGLMIESAKANLLQDSYFADGSTTYWRNSPTAPTSLATSTDYANPYGGGQVLKFVSGGSGRGMQTAIAKKVALTQGVNYTVWALVRGTGTVKMYADIPANTFGPVLFLSPNEWRVVSLSWTPNQTANANIGVLSNDATTTCYIALIQLETTPSSSFIPTTTASLTRGAETLTYLNLGNRTAATESIFMRYAPFWSATSPTNPATLLDSDADRVVIQFVTSDDSFAFFPNSTDSVQTSGVSVSDPNINTNYILSGIAYGSTADVNSEIYVDGVTKGTDSDNYTTPDLGTKFYIGSDNSGANQADSLISSIVIYSDAKSSSDVSNIYSILASP